MAENLFTNDAYRAKYSKATQGRDTELAKRKDAIVSIVSAKIGMNLADTRICLGDGLVSTSGIWQGEWNKEKARVHIANETLRIAKDSVGKRSRI